jgi:hypothetical protein
VASVGCDRRILKAFYTQYVAVLLILLTFCVGAYQRASQSARLPVIHEPAILTPVHEGPRRIASMTMENVFDDGGEIPAKEPHLFAVAAFVKSHDVRAVVSLSVARRYLDTNPGLLDTLIARVDAIESFLLLQAVPPDAFVVRVITEGGEGRVITVDFENTPPGSRL